MSTHKTSNAGFSFISRPVFILKQQLPKALKIGSQINWVPDKLRGLPVSSFGHVTLNFDSSSKFAKWCHKSRSNAHEWELFMKVSTSSYNKEIDREIQCIFSHMLVHFIKQPLKKPSMAYLLSSWLSCIEGFKTLIIFLLFLELFFQNPWCFLFLFCLYQFWRMCPLIKLPLK